ncbi:MAG: hypothetical protein QOI11_1079 [Candidatus Eremiobacteraeota bacterium]|nr:hypothetical protein [Candidatus Eremiobacteraeota bacterium]
MQQLTLVAPRTFEWREVPEPVLGGELAALVAPLAVASCDLDPDIIHGRTGHGLPIAFGHEFVGEIVAVGGAVERFAPGDVVAVAFQISCGTCDACRRGHTASCRAVPPLAAYGLGEARGAWGGALSYLVRVPYADAMWVRFPAGLDPLAVASASDNIADGHRNVAAPLAARPGAPVLIVGGHYGSIGLYTLDMALALGSEAVTYVDHDPDRLALARAAGATALDAADGYPAKIAGEFPITVNCGTAEGLATAIRSTASNGVCTNTVIFWDNLHPLPLLEMYLNPIALRTGRINSRAHLEHVIDLAAQGRIHPERFTDRVVPWHEAGEVLANPRHKTIIARRPT